MFAAHNSARNASIERPVNKRIELHTRVKRLGLQMQLNGLAWPTNVYGGKKKRRFRSGGRQERQDNGRRQ